MDRPAKANVSCPKCKSKNLTIIESATWLTEWDVQDGIFDRSEGYANPASIDRVDVNCKDCGHGWKPRKAWQVDDICTEHDEKDNDWHDRRATGGYAISATAEFGQVLKEKEG